MAEQEAEELFQQLLTQTALIKDQDAFRETHGFTLDEYLKNREIFTQTCREHADHIEKVVRDTGIAKTTGGGVGIASGGAAIAGILLAPFTFGWSIGLTVGGIAGGVASAATSITAQIVKDRNVNADKEKIESALKAFETKEKVIGGLFSSIQVNLKKLRELMEDPSVLQMVKDISAGAKAVSWNIVYQGVNIVQAFKAIKFAKSVAEFFKTDFYEMAAVIAEGTAAPGIGGDRIFGHIFGQELITTGSTTAKVLSGAVGVIGIGFGIWDVVQGAQEINGSEVAETYRKFSNDYEGETASLRNGINELKKIVA